MFANAVNEKDIHRCFSIIKLNVFQAAVNA